MCKSRCEESKSFIRTLQSIIEHNRMFSNVQNVTDCDCSALLTRYCGPNWEPELMIWLSLPVSAGPGGRCVQWGGRRDDRDETSAAKQAQCAVWRDWRLCGRAGGWTGGGQLWTDGGQTHPHAAAERTIHQCGHGRAHWGRVTGSNQNTAVQRPGLSHTR